MKTKKVGILTFHKSINYGSVLQCWALQKTIEKLGYKVEIIDYEPKIYKNLYGLFNNKWKHNLNVLPVVAFRFFQDKAFSNFRNKELNLSEYKYFYDSDYSRFNEYDAIVCGSDQIWNLNAVDCDDIFFLPFHIHGRKLAYAVSINNTNFSETRANEHLRDDIIDFNFISEREKSGAQKISSFIDNKKKIYSCLDPTLLHTRSDFEIITSKRFIKQPYIFLYNVWSGTDGFDSALKLSERLHLPIYTGFMGRTFSSVYRIEKMGIKVELLHTSPSDFLSLIKHADWVVTDSFHGTAFSLIFEKNFISINKLDQNGNPCNDERISNILQSIGLSDHFITVKEVNNFNFKNKIDYKAVTDKRMELANISIDMLCNAIEGRLDS